MVKYVLERKNDINEGDAESSIVELLGKASDELYRAQKIAKKDLPEGKRLAIGIMNLISTIEDEIMFVQKGEYK